jgi:sporulation protein YhbH
MGSVFSHHKTVADRSASDRRRHKQKIDRAIKDGIHDIVAEESIIGQDGKKKIRIPVKGIKEYKFVYGSNGGGVGGGGDLDLKKGQVIKEGKKKPGQGQGNKPGNEPGQEYYDVEVTLDELAEYLFTDLELPDLEKKALKQIVSEKWKRKGYRPKGIRPRLSKKETAKQRIKRKKAAERNGTIEEDEDFSFRESDLRYKHITKTEKKISSAVIFFIMDVSGSMSKKKKYLARSFFFLLYHFIRSKYEKTEIIFIAHDTQPYEVDEEKFFGRGTGGGTMVSPTLEYVDNAIQSRYNPTAWNIYAFHCSDGDNWPSDNEKTLALSLKLAEKCQLYGYCEIEPAEESLRWLSETSLGSLYKTVNEIKSVFIKGKNDVFPAFKKFFNKVE